MNALRKFTLFRIIAAFAALAFLGAAIPAPAQAAAQPTFSIVSVNPNVSVTVLTYNFPANTLFTVRMDRMGNAAVNGIIVTQTNTGAGGSFQETYSIPAELRGVTQIAMRFESSNGYYAYNWFNNYASGTYPTPPPTSTPAPGTYPTTPPSYYPTPVPGSSGWYPKGPYILVTNVVANTSLTAQVYNLPLYTNFSVRVGPYYNFSKAGEAVATIYTGTTPTFSFTVNMPGSMYNVDLGAIRIDSANGYYAYNSFHNVTSSASTPVPGTTPSASYGCQITSYSPTGSIQRNAEFDMKWTVKNTGSSNWDMHQVDYKYLSGTKMYKYNSTYDLPTTVKPGESITIIVDSIAPQYSGWYSTTWGLVVGSSVVCYMPMSVYFN